MFPYILVLCKSDIAREREAFPFISTAIMRCSFQKPQQATTLLFFHSRILIDKFKLFFRKIFFKMLHEKTRLQDEKQDAVILVSLVSLLLLLIINISVSE